MKRDNYPPLAVQDLLTLASLLDQARPERFDMTHWHCGTSACAIGHWCDTFSHDTLQIDFSRSAPLREPYLADPPPEFPPTVSPFVHVAWRFGLSLAEACFLFGQHSNWLLMVLDYDRDEYPADVRRRRRWARDWWLAHRPLRWWGRGGETPAVVAARIRKLVYYKLKKAELAECWEEARRREGDWQLCQQVRAQALAASLH